MLSAIALSRYESDFLRRITTHVKAPIYKNLLNDYITLFGTVATGGVMTTRPNILSKFSR